MAAAPPPRAEALTIKQIADTPNHPNRYVAGKYLEEANDSLWLLLSMLDCVRKSVEPDYDPHIACAWQRGHAPSPSIVPSSSASSWDTTEQLPSLEPGE